MVMLCNTSYTFCGFLLLQMELYFFDCFGHTFGKRNFVIRIIKHISIILAVFIYIVTIWFVHAINMSIWFVHAINMSILHKVYKIFTKTQYIC